METPLSPFKKGGPMVKGSGIKRDGESQEVPPLSVKGTLKAFKVIINHPAIAAATATRR